MKICGHKNNKECAWSNAEPYNNTEETKKCGQCYISEETQGGKMVKGAYQGVQPNSKYRWNVYHITKSKPRNSSCKNLIAMHTKCNNILQ